MLLWLCVYKHRYACVGIHVIIISIVIQNERHYSIIQLSLVFKIGIPLKFKRYEIHKHPNGGVFSKNLSWSLGLHFSSFYAKRTVANVKTVWTHFRVIRQTLNYNPPVGTAHKPKYFRYVTTDHQSMRWMYIKVTCIYYIYTFKIT